MRIFASLSDKADHSHYIACRIDLSNFKKITEAFLILNIKSRESFAHTVLDFETIDRLVQCTVCVNHLMDCCCCFDWRLVFSVIVLIVAYKRITVFNYYMKFLIYYSYEIVSSTLLIPMGIVRPRDVANALVASYVMKQPSKFLGIKYKIEGIENLKADKTFVIVSNHQTSLDILGMQDIVALDKI